MLSRFNLNNLDTLAFVTCITTGFLWSSKLWHIGFFQKQKQLTHVITSNTTQISSNLTIRAVCSVFFYYACTTANNYLMSAKYMNDETLKKCYYVVFGAATLELGHEVLLYLYDTLRISGWKKGK